MDLTQDARVRAAAFAWLADQVDRLGTHVLPHAILKEGLELDRTRAAMSSRTSGPLRPTTCLQSWTHQSA